MTRSIHRIAVILIAAVFLAAGLWKMSDPAGAAVRLAQAKVPESLSLWVAASLAIAETAAGIMLLVRRWRKWGGVLGSALLLAFMAYIGIHYAELRGADCSCFPWVKRAVGPGFFLADGLMLVLAAFAAATAPPSRSARAVLLLFLSLAALTVVSSAANGSRHTGTKAPDTIAAEDGHAIPLHQGRVFLFFFDPQCLHCLEAGRKLAALDWGTTRLIGVPTQNPQFAGWFMGKAGLLTKASLSRDLTLLKKTFPFDLPPVGIALEDGYEKAMLLQFEGSEPRATLVRLNFAH